MIICARDHRLLSKQPLNYVESVAWFPSPDFGADDVVRIEMIPHHGSIPFDSMTRTVEGLVRNLTRSLAASGANALVPMPASKYT